MIAKNNILLVIILVTINMMDFFIFHAQILMGFSLSVLILLILTSLMIRFFSDKYKNTFSIIGRIIIMCLSILISSFLFKATINHFIIENGKKEREKILMNIKVKNEFYKPDKFLGYPVNYHKLETPKIVIDKVNYKRQDLDIKTGFLSEAYEF